MHEEQCCGMNYMEDTCSELSRLMYCDRKCAVNHAEIKAHSTHRQEAVGPTTNLEVLEKIKLYFSLREMDHISSDAPFPYSGDCSDYSIPEPHYYYYYYYYYCCCYCYYCYYCCYYCVSCHSLFHPDTSPLEPTVIPSNQALRADHSISRTISGAPSTAVCCSESVECFTGTVSKFFFNTFVSIPVAPIITGLIIHFMFHIRFTSICKLFYFL